MSRHPLGALYDRMRLIMFRENIPEARATDLLFEELSQDPDAVLELWREMGPWFVKRAMDEVWKVGPDKLGCTSAARLKALAAQSPPVVRRPRAAPVIADGAINPLDVPYPIGAFGERKRLGDWTRDDVVEARESFYKRGRRLIATGDRWNRVAEVMAEDETIEQMLRRVPAEEREGFPPSLQSATPPATEDDTTLNAEALSA